MTAAYVSHASSGAAVGGAITVTKPAGTAQGDLLLALLMGATDALTWSAPSGFTQHANSLSTGKALWTKIAGASEPASYVWDPSGTNINGVLMVCITSVDAGAPIDVASGVAGTGNLVLPSITSAGADRLLFSMVMKSANNVRWTPPGTSTERFDTNQSTTFTHAGGDEVVGSGATGTRTWTPASGTGASHGYMLAIAPVPPPISPARIESVATVHTPSIVLGVAVGLIASGSQIFTPTLVPVLEPARVEASDVVHLPALDQLVNSPRIESASIVYAPATVQSVDVSRIESTAVVDEPRIDLSLEPPSIVTTSTVYTPDVVAMQVVQPERVESTATVLAPTLNLGISVGRVESAASVPTHNIGLGVVVEAMIASTATVYAPEIGATVTLARVESAAIVPSPAMSQGVVVPRVESTATVYAPRVNYVPRHHTATVREVVRTHAIAEVTRSHTIADKSRKTTVREGIA